MNDYQCSHEKVVVVGRGDAGYSVRCLHCGNVFFHRLVKGVIGDQLEVVKK